MIYLLILLKPILFPVLLNSYLLLDLIILRSINIGRRIGQVLFHNHLLLVATSILKKWSIMPIIWLLVPMILVLYGILHVTNVLSRFLFGLERQCTTSMMESGIQIYPTGGRPWCPCESFRKIAPW